MYSCFSDTCLRAIHNASPVYRHFDRSNSSHLLYNVCSIVDLTMWLCRHHHCRPSLPPCYLTTVIVVSRSLSNFIITASSTRATKLAAGDFLSGLQQIFVISHILGLFAGLQQTRSSRPVAKLETVSGHHPTGGVLKADLSPHGSTRSAGTLEYR